jgi:hypothetical protein
MEAKWKPAVDGTSVTSGADSMVYTTPTGLGTWTNTTVDPVSVPTLDQAWIDSMSKPKGEPTFEYKVRNECERIADLLISKNKKYGNSALDPVRIFSTVDRLEQLRVRIDDKLYRISNGSLDEDEDVVQDLIGYLILYRIAGK